MKYICKRCKKYFRQKIDYNRHINRKNPCRVKINQKHTNIYKVDNIEDSNVTINDGETYYNKQTVAKNATTVAKNATMVAKNATDKNTYTANNLSRTICKYCGKHISAYKYMKRHYKSCKHKIEIEKDIIIHEQAKELEEKNKELQNLKNIEKEYFEFMKKMADKSTISNTIYNNYNMFYVLNNYKSPHNFEDLMAPALTQKEKDYIIKYGAIAGCFKLLEIRCLDNIEIEKRPFHCVDGSRTKYMLHTNNDWVVDNNGTKILNSTYPKIRSVYNYRIIDNDCDLDDKIENLKQLVNMESNVGKKQILKELIKRTLLKNNVKE